MPKHLSYELRFPSELRTPPDNVNQALIFNWHTNLLYPLFSTGGPRGREDNDGGVVWYFREGFVPVQDAIARAFTKLSCTDPACQNQTLPEIVMQRFPYPPFTLDVLLQGLETIVSFFILLSFIYPCINTVRFIAIEKEKQLKEAMKIMGMEILFFIHFFKRCRCILFIQSINIFRSTELVALAELVCTHNDFHDAYDFLYSRFVKNFNV